MRSAAKIIGLIAVAGMGYSGAANAISMFGDTAPDGAKYSLAWTNVGDLYTFTFKADFTGVTTSNALGDFAWAFSIATVPGSVDWNAGSITAAPGAESGWGISEGVVTNSNGCPIGTSDSKDWCIGLNSTATQGAAIATGSILEWVFTMTRTAGAPDFSGDPAWSYKFMTTTGAVDPDGVLVFGNYQISRTLGTCTDENNCEPGDEVLPEPGTLALLGLGLLGLGATRRKRAV